MPETNGPALVIDDGGIPALVSVLLEADPERVYVWPVGSGPRARAVTTSRTKRLALGGIVGGGQEAPPDSSSLLIAAGHLAIVHGLSRVIWPVYSGLDVDRMSEISARVRLIEDLLLLDARPGDPDVRIDVPLFDLSESEICDLAIDLDAPLDRDSVWWCPTSGEERCGACGGCQTWLRAIDGPRVWESVAGA